MIKKLLAGSVLALLVINSSYAGKGPPATEEERAARMERMQQHLELSDEQVAEMRRIREEGGGREEVRALMTDEQRDKFDQMRERHRKQKHGRTGE